jgi:hypothetical protein
MASPKHMNAARQMGWTPTHCDGKVRRVYVRAGSGRYYVPVGWMCDRCGQGSLDEARGERIAEVTSFPRDRAEVQKQVERQRQRRQTEKAGQGSSSSDDA